MNTYDIEKSILSSMSDNELKIWQRDIDLPITEWLQGKSTIKKEYELYRLDEINFWFIYYFRYEWEWRNEWETKQHLSKRLSYELRKRSPNTKSNYKEVDINDVSIIDIISRYTRVPSNYNKKNFPCPIHKEKTGSFRIYENTNSYHCYGCHSWWWPYQFYCAMEWYDVKDKKAFKNFIELFFN